MNLWKLELYATRCTTTEMEVVMKPGCVAAETELEAINRSDFYYKEVFPPSEGWTNHWSRIGEIDDKKNN